mmetsp:Transcript_20515/g.50205  ORF Transcript_20515/g.50205 Transcript_20515/m.50205 type:complete len:227 (-) Transcript_20515:72-752(-)|eukprot:CAMPEP_0198315738 /NCGR_PEP_ID=MMETSP1450-20131203/5899_1 /TAXON_ID=753684 ORGANISM="Madagascaria erythrocladiodes, Strain CCMP3234" /NCGR_SAMPLE_ID=MMETSP1450 /ASSEMBLY_ACC=CAM_ASM_001115 /LENGTH=226 /DNA_ID=CAMNT_0044018863 /DNA_START=378 /DNA_END=1058 /DNA_ORIENTATION=+
MAQTTMVRFAAVARLADRVPLATYVAADPRDIPQDVFDEKLGKVLRSGRVAEHARLTITDKDVGNIHYDSDPSCLFLVMTSADYPQRAAFKFLTELRVQFQDRFEPEIGGAKAMGLSRPGRGILKDLCQQYNVVENVDKVAQVNVQVEEVKTAMQENIQTVMRNQENLETLVDKSDMMRNEAQAFQRTAGEVKNKMWWQNTKMLILIVLGLLVLILVIVVPIAIRS